MFLREYFEKVNFEESQWTTIKVSSMQRTKPAPEIMVLIVYGKTCLKRPLKKDPKLSFKTDYRLMQIKSIVEFFQPSLSYHF